MQNHIDAIKKAIEEKKANNAPQEQIEALELQLNELEVQSINFDAIPPIEFKELYPRPDVEAKQASEVMQSAVSPIVAKLDTRPSEEIIGMARNATKAIDPDGKMNPGDILRHFIEDLQKAQEAKHEHLTAYADVHTAKKDADTAERVARRNLYGAFARYIEEGEIKLTERRKNEAGETLDSWELPNWLPSGLDVQNASELVYDENQLMAYVMMFQVWDVVSIDTDKLERWLKRQEEDRAGKRTQKYAMPVPPPVVSISKFKPVVGKEANWTPDETE